VADLLQRAGVTHLVTMDLHAAQVGGFFDFPVDNLSGRPDLVERIKPLGIDQVVAPDVGSIKVATGYAIDLGVDFATADKRRLSPEAVEITHLVGEVKGKRVLLTDDLCSTGATLAAAAYECKQRGAAAVFAAVTHGLFVDGALERIAQSPIEKIFTADTVPGIPDHPKVERVSVGKRFGERINGTDS